jgi:CBS domain-containing protein
MSARAAWRLESLGFSHVYRYVAGKMDWFAAGLPREGRLAPVARIGDVVQRDAPTCDRADRVGDVRERVEAAGWDRAVVVNSAGVVLGILTGMALREAAAETPVETAMDPGPVTYRPDTPVSQVIEHLHQSHAKAALVTTADGILVGTYRHEQGPADAE